MLSENWEIRAEEVQSGVEQEVSIQRKRRAVGAEDDPESQNISTSKME